MSPFDDPAVGTGARAAPLVLALTAVAVSIWVAVKLDRRPAAPDPGDPGRPPARETVVADAKVAVPR